MHKQTSKVERMKKLINRFTYKYIEYIYTYMHAYTRYTYIHTYTLEKELLILLACRVARSHLEALAACSALPAMPEVGRAPVKGVFDLLEDGHTLDGIKRA